MISMKLSLDKRWKRIDGSFAIIFRITYKGKTRDISTGFTCKEKEWDTRHNCVRVICPETKILSHRLTEQRFKYQERLLEFERRLLEPNTDIQTVKEYLVGKSHEKITVHDFWVQEIIRLKTAKQFGNARNYRSAMLGIALELNLKKPFSSIDYNTLMQLDSKLRAKGVKPNSIAVYMRTLRALYNKAINFGVVDQQEYPFRRYKIKGEQTPPRVASIEELKRYFSFDPAPNSNWYDAWNYGKLIFLLRGINFADLAFLTEENIRHGRLIYKRRKTHKMYSVELLPEAIEILKLYKSDHRINLLPILTDNELKNPKQLPERIGQQTKNCNKWLKRLGEELDITEKLSTYVFRYSHANACKKLGFSKDLISESLGHAYGLAVSTAYLENFNVELIDEMNKKVVDEVSPLRVKKG